MLGTGDSLVLPWPFSLPTRSLHVLAGRPRGGARILPTQSRMPGQGALRDVPAGLDQARSVAQRSRQMTSCTEVSG